MNDIRPELYREVLTSKNTQAFVNRGIVKPKDKPLYTYEMQRNGLSWFYCKRMILPDGISTKPLDL